MDDFEKNYPGFNWRETAANDHPGGILKCPCPKCEYMRDIINTNSSDKTNTNLMTYRLCPDHYKICMEFLKTQLGFMAKMQHDICVKLGIVKYVELKYKDVELCYYCKFGSGGRGIVAPPPEARI